MLIKKIYCRNFRQFKEPTVLNFTEKDGKINIIYSDNGGGKTTLHQLFSWIFYGKYSFSNDIGNKLYNLEFESELHPETSFTVEGSIDYYCDIYKTDFSIKRIQYFKKDFNKSIQVGNSQFEIRYINENGDWTMPNTSMDYLNNQLPETLSHYFLFDGERMVSAFKNDNRSSKNSENDILKNTFYSIFELDILNNAIKHLEKVNRKFSTISCNDNALKNKMTNIEEDIAVYENQIISNEKKLKMFIDEKEEINKKLIQISRELSVIPDISELEEKRKKYVAELRELEDDYKSNKLKFGESLISNITPLLLAKLNYPPLLELDKNSDIPLGINEDLLSFLLSEEFCICGNRLDTQHKDKLNQLLYQIPNFDHRTAYSSFLRNIEKNITEYDFKKRNARECYNDFEKNIIRQNDINFKIEECDSKIITSNNDHRRLLVSKRSDIEHNIKHKDECIINENINIKSDEKELNKLKVDFQKIEEANNKNSSINLKKAMCEDMISELYSRLERENEDKTKKLEYNIDQLTKEMFDGTRNVRLDQNYVLHVSDNYNNEALSEGQFAVVTFAYIGGIIKTLNELEIQKKFPLILDGPFSKLGEKHRSSLSNTLPTFANQVIVFSKDNLDNLFPEDSIGKVYEIISNESKNISEIKEIK